MMVEACPSFADTWSTFLEEWRAEVADLPLYLSLADLARHLIAMLERGETQTFGRIFGVVELWHSEGEHYVREAATVGLLEDLQNEGLHRTTKPEQFRRFLGPVSETWWDRLYEFWNEGTLLTDE
jgi:hypothetical protein